MFDFNILKAWCEMLKLIAQSAAAKRFMWLTYFVFLLALLIWKSADILTAAAQFAK